MTPQLMQAIKLLQLTNLELSAVIDKELEENPLLERAETDDDGPEPALSERPRAERDTDAAAPDDLPDAVVPADRDMAAIRQIGIDCMDSADFREGRNAFMEKRKPQFKGR